MESSFASNPSPTSPRAIQELPSRSKSTATSLASHHSLRSSKSGSIRSRDITKSQHRQSTPSSPSVKLAGDREIEEILPLSIPTQTEHLFSGFAYHQNLFDVHVSPKQWEEFNKDLKAALKPTRFDRFSARLSKHKIIPIGVVYLTARSIKAANKRALEKRVLQSLQDDVGESMGELAATLKRWNEDIFTPLGLDVNIQLTSSAIKRIQKEEKKRKEEERKTRALYGTTAFHPDDDEEEEPISPDTAEAGKKYTIVISQLEDDDEGPPAYDNSPSELDTEKEGDQVPMLDSAPSMPVEMPDTSANAAFELPAAVTLVPTTISELPDTSTTPKEMP